MKIGVAFITHNSKHHLKNCLPPIVNSPLKPKVLVVNSSSNDGTVELAEEMGVETLVVPRPSFNHGTTRERARKALACDIVVMMTPDAYAEDENVLEKLVRPLIEKKASIAYARQLPHHGAGYFEAFARQFNYPAKSHIRKIEDIAVYGVYTFFCSDSCAAYLNSALDEIGGFPSVLTGEDTVVTAKLLRKGHAIAYVAEAEVRHSHTYSIKQEFERNFDTGLAREGYRHLIVSDQKRGKDYVKALFKSLIRKPYLIPYAFVQTVAKYIGYKMGQASVNAPTSFKKMFSGQDFYWISEDYLQNR